MILNIKSRIPFGKFKHVQIEFILDNLNSTTLDYMLWWHKTIQTHTFNDDIIKVLKDKQQYYDNIREDYRIQEHMRDKSYDDPQPVQTKSRGWDLPIDDKPLEYYLYR